MTRHVPSFLTRNHTKNVTTNRPKKEDKKSDINTSDKINRTKIG